MKIAILSPFNPMAVADLLPAECRQGLMDNGVNSSSVNALVRSLVALGHEVCVFTLYDFVDGVTVFTGKGIALYVVPNKPPVEHVGLSMLRHRYIPQRLARAVRGIKGGVDVVHAQWAYEYAAAAALLANKWPVFCTSRDWLPYLKSFPMSRTERLLFYAKEQCYKRVMACRKMHFIANSEYMRRCMDSVNGVTTVAVIPNSVRHEFILQQEKHYPEVPTFLFMAQSIDERRKNVTTLLRAFALLLKETPESRLLIVGRYGKEDGSVWQRGRGEGLMRNVSFMGQVPHLEIIRLLDGASALVHPALEETFGNIFLEAAGRKVPCIGGKEAGAIPDVLGHGKYGCLCDVTSAESLKDAMQKVVTDHAYRDSLVAKAFSNLMANYAEGVVAQKHIDIYRKYIWGR